MQDGGYVNLQKPVGPWSRKCNARSGLYDIPDLADCKSWTRNLPVFVAIVTCEGEKNPPRTTTLVIIAVDLA